MGQCHVISSPEEYDATSEPRPPVPCDMLHTTQTFHVTVFPQPLAAQESRPNQQQLKAAAGTLCPTRELRKYLAGGERDGTTGVAVTAYFPSRDDWAGGDRTVRCDVLLTTPDGVPRLSTLDLAGALKGPASTVLRLCYRQEIRDGVLSDDGVDVPCSEPHTAEDVSAWFNLDTTLQSAAARHARCLPYALEFLRTKELPAQVLLRPVIRISGNQQAVRCAVAPLQEGLAPLTGSLAPAAAPGDASGPTAVSAAPSSGASRNG